MATYTENYNLEKPAQSDLYNVDVFNENADKIDEALGDKAENQSLAPIESSSTASRNYSVGQQFVYNGLLYEATAAIASGGTITPGSNCARTTVAEELSALNDSLTNLASYDNGTDYNFTVNNVGYYFRQYRSMTVCSVASQSVSYNYPTWTTIHSVPSGMRSFQFITIVTVSGIVLALRAYENNIQVITYNGGTGYIQGSGVTTSTRP